MYCINKMAVGTAFTEAMLLVMQHNKQHQNPVYSLARSELSAGCGDDNSTAVL